MISTLVRTTVAAACALAVAASAAGTAPPSPDTAAARRQLPTIPALDHFYDAPSNLSAYAPGDVISRRHVAPPAVQGPQVASAEQVLYRTTNTQNEPSYSVATLFTPKRPASEPAVVSVQLYEDSANSECAPSYALMAGFSGPNWPIASVDSPIVIKWALDQGYHVVASDHEGPRNGFIAGFEEGQAGLDGIRAAIHANNFAPKTKVTMYGYSGGAHTTAWMSTLAESYAPDLNVVGVAHGGTPVDLISIVKFLEGGPFAGFVMSGISGILNVYKELNKLAESKCSQNDFLNPIGFMRTQGNCLPSVVLHYNFARFTDKCDLGKYDFFNYPGLKEMFHRETLLQSVASGNVSVPKFPRLMWHAQPDEIVPFAPAQQYVYEQCEKGADLQFASLPVGEHVRFLFYFFFFDSFLVPDDHHPLRHHAR